MRSVNGDQNGANLKKVVSLAGSHHTTLAMAKKIETGTQAKHRRVHARQITRLCHVRGCLNFFGQGSST